MLHVPPFASDHGETFLPPRKLSHYHKSGWQVPSGHTSATDAKDLKLLQLRDNNLTRTTSDSSYVYP